ncbi:MAG: NADPH-dependent FMN reductase [Gemmatimonadota bacterium]
MGRTIRLLTISGSLRAESSNTSALVALELVAPSGVHVTHYRDLGELPHFNPDLDAEGMTPAASVAALRAAFAAADAVVICSPEYAHGVPGSLKNALDWMVSDLDLPGKPIALLNLSPRSIHAQDSLRETLTTMSTRVIPAASLTLPLSGRRLSAEEIAANSTLAAILRESLAELVAAVATQAELPSFPVNKLSGN